MAFGEEKKKKWKKARKKQIDPSTSADRPGRKVISNETLRTTRGEKTVR